MEGFSHRIFAFADGCDDRDDRDGRDGSGAGTVGADGGDDRVGRDGPGAGTVDVDGSGERVDRDGSGGWNGGRADAIVSSRFFNSFRTEVLTDLTILRISL